jgi:hypothetical protein
LNAVETDAHRRLKLLALAFLREHGCQAVAVEVRCPISRYRVDVAGYVDTVGPAGPTLTHEGADAKGNGRHKFRLRRPLTVFIECKQSRADFLRDRRDTDRLLRERQDLDRYRRTLEEKRIKAEEPQLRRAGSSLFADLEEWDFAASRLPAYRDVLKRLRRLDRMLHGQTKFCMAARYALADRLYIAAPRGLIRQRELPPGWGLLETSRKSIKEEDPNADLFGDSLLSITVKAPVHAPRDVFRQHLLRNIAVSASYAASNAMGVFA